jgi:hypothetical protein
MQCLAPYRKYGHRISGFTWEQSSTIDHGVDAVITTVSIEILGQSVHVMISMGTNFDIGFINLS